MKPELALAARQLMDRVSGVRPQEIPMFTAVCAELEQEAQPAIEKMQAEQRQHLAEVPGGNDADSQQYQDQAGGQ